ncbi:MAG: hypothetical protein ACO3UU_09010 [Minisyncoccia bacterium]|jgi:hypothetical protein
MPRKTLQQRQRSRLAGLVKKFIGTEDADDTMIEIMNVLTESPLPPVAGKYYVFVYNAKTPNIQYDQNPFVYVKKVYNWGFTGLNYHWGKERQYTWDEIAGKLYEIYPSEIEDLKRLSFGNVRTK